MQKTAHRIQVITHKISSNTIPYSLRPRNVYININCNTVLISTHTHTRLIFCRVIFRSSLTRISLDHIIQKPVNERKRRELTDLKDMQKISSLTSHTYEAMLATAPMRAHRTL